MAAWKRWEERLVRVEQLLMCPTPENIREADTLLSGLLRDCAAAGPRTAENSEAIRTAEEAFRVRCGRVRKLLEGARRAIWIRMRLITCLSQTYTARAERKHWIPPSGTINIRM